MNQKTALRLLAAAAIGAVPGFAAAECPEWLPLGAGVGSDVLALEVFEGELIAAGQFTTAGGEPAARVAAWDGESWRSLDSTIDETVRSMTVYNDRLVIGGGFVVAGGQAARCWRRGTASPGSRSAAGRTTRSSPWAPTTSATVRSC